MSNDRLYWWVLAACWLIVIGNVGHHPFLPWQSMAGIPVLIVLLALRSLVRPDPIDFGDDIHMDNFERFKEARRLRRGLRHERR